jgi:hypothetical protein
MKKVYCLFRIQPIEDPYYGSYKDLCHIFADKKVAGYFRELESEGLDEYDDKKYTVEEWDVEG